MWNHLGIMWNHLVKRISKEIIGEPIYSPRGKVQNTLVKWKKNPFGKRVKYLFVLHIRNDSHHDIFWIHTEELHQLVNIDNISITYKNHNNRAVRREQFNLLFYRPCFCQKENWNSNRNGEKKERKNKFLLIWFVRGKGLHVFLHNVFVHFILHIVLHIRTITYKINILDNYLCNSPLC